MPPANLHPYTTLSAQASLIFAATVINGIVSKMTSFQSAARQMGPQAHLLSLEPAQTSPVDKWGGQDRHNIPGMGAGAGGGGNFRPRVRYDPSGVFYKPLF